MTPAFRRFGPLFSFDDVSHRPGHGGGLAPRSRGLSTSATAVLSVLSVVLLGTGCLSHRHVVPKAELERLTTLPPGMRGQQVRVIQDLGARRGPAVRPQVPANPQTPVYDARPGYVDTGPNVGAVVFIGGGRRRYRPVGPAVRPRGYARASSASLVAPAAGPGAGFAPVGGTRQLGAPVPGTPVGGATKPSTGGLGSGKSMPIKGSKVDDMKDAAVIATLVGVATGIGVAASEGARFDGTVATDPNQPLTLKWNDGRTLYLNLAELHPTHLPNIKEAYLNDDEFYGLRRLRRGPLDREGGAFELALGSRGARFTAGRVQSFASRLALGYFPVHWAGVLAAADVNFGTAPSGADFFSGYWSLELQAMPLALGKLHLGGFASAGYVSKFLEGVNDATGEGYSFGALMQIELTTRLALTGRFTWDFHPDELGNRDPSFGALVGLSVY